MLTRSRLRFLAPEGGGGTRVSAAAGDGGKGADASENDAESGDDASDEVDDDADANDEAEADDEDEGEAEADEAAAEIKMPKSAFDKRLARESKKATRELMSRLGVSTEEELDALVALREEREAASEAEKSELELAQAEIERLKAEVAEYEEQAERTEQDKFLSEHAAAAGFDEDNEILLRHLRKYLDDEDVDDDEDLTPEIMDDFFAKLRAKKPRYFAEKTAAEPKAKATTGGDGGAGGRRGAKEEVWDATKHTAEENRARRQQIFDGRVTA